jgi:hypothetical protein
LRLEKERIEKEKLERDKLERERKKQLEEEENRKRKNFKNINEIKENYDNKKIVEYVPQKLKKNENEFMDELQYNQGDKDLEPYFAPLARNAGGNIPSPDISKLRRALRQGILTVTGVRLYSAIICDNWKLREAAVKAFLEFVENPLVNYLLK